MPLKKGLGAKTRSENISEIVHSFMESGKMGASHPKSKKAAIKQAVAISFAQQRRNKRKGF